LLQRAGKETRGDGLEQRRAHAPACSSTPAVRARRQAHAWPIPAPIGPSDDDGLVDGVVHTVDARIEFPRQLPRCVICGTHEFTTLAFNSPWRQSGSFCSRYLYPRCLRSSFISSHASAPSTPPLHSTVADRSS
jgi:hypothetical protein